MQNPLRIQAGRRHLILFFALAYALSWALMVPEALAAHGFIERSMAPGLVALSIFGPTVAAVIAAGVQGGLDSIRSLMRRLLQFKIHWIWYAVVVIGPALIFLAGLGLEIVVGGQPVSILEPPLKSDLGLAEVPLALFFLGLAVNNLIMTAGEEIGWRGYALPRLQHRQTALGAGLILGVLWGLWHLPLAFAPSTRSAVSQLPFWVYLVDIIAMSVLYVWVFNHTRGSLALATILHAATNTWAPFLMPPGTASPRQFYFTVAIRVLVAIVVVVYFGVERLRRGPAVRHS